MDEKGLRRFSDSPAAFPAPASISSKDSPTKPTSSRASSSNSITGGNLRLERGSKRSSDDAGKAGPAGPAPANGSVKPVVKHVRFRSRDDIVPSPPRTQFMLSPASCGIFFRSSVAGCRECHALEASSEVGGRVRRPSKAASSRIPPGTSV